MRRGRNRYFWSPALKKGKKRVIFVLEASRISGGYATLFGQWCGGAMKLVPGNRRVIVTLFVF